MIRELEQPIRIAGPCAAESEEQLVSSTREALKRDVQIVRASLWKPRTRHPEGIFQGVKYKGIPWLVKIAKMGVIPATEVIIPEHARRGIDAFESDPDLKGKKRLVLWLGSRNQNDCVQEAVGRAVKNRPWVALGIKNHMYLGDESWLGSLEAVLNGGASQDQLFLIHRGYQPGKKGFRNSLDFKSAEDLRELTRLPMIYDPSHSGGSVKKVFTAAKMIGEANIPLSGHMVEVHPDPPCAKTDKLQQLTWKEYNKLLPIIEKGMNQSEEAA